MRCPRCQSSKNVKEFTDEHKKKFKTCNTCRKTNREWHKKRKAIPPKDKVIIFFESLEQDPVMKREFLNYLMVSFIATKPAVNPPLPPRPTEIIPLENMEQKVNG